MKSLSAVWLNKGRAHATAMQPELWIGLVELKPLDRQAYGAAGAFTNIVTWADDEACFRRKAEMIAATLEMFVMDVEGAEPLAERTRKRRMTQEIDEMVLRAKCNPNAIVYGTFHQYPFDEA
jgi:hypothetical protein